MVNGWTWTTVGECGNVVTGRTPSKSDASNYGNFMPFVKPPELLHGSVYSAEDNISEKGTTEARVLPVNSVLVSCIGNLGKTGINRVPVAFNQQINAVIFPGNIIPEFGFYYFQSSEFKKLLEGVSSATTVSIVNKSKFESLPFPIAPLPEQERIVAKIEELFTQLEAGTAALKRVRAGLKRYKASVLKAAMEGRLLNDEGRMQNDGDLPDRWKWTTIGELAQHLTSGSRGWASYYSDEGSLFVRVGNFNRLSKTIDLNKKQFVNAPQTAEANRTRLKKRDLLITMTADVGMVGIVDDNTLRWGDAYINQHVGLVRLKDSDFVEYVAYALASECGQKQFREKQYGLTKVGLNFDDIRSLKIPLPPLDEQRRIVAEVERRLSVAQEVESVLAASVARAGRLRQSVLKSAFEGRLG